MSIVSSDWFAPGAGEVDEEVAELHRVLTPGGMVFWRSAARYPWYSRVFKRAGFKVEVLGMREGPHKAIDRVNMCVNLFSFFFLLAFVLFDAQRMHPLMHWLIISRYASFWKATKV